MFIHTMPVGVFQCNCTIVACETSRQALVVDPGDDPDRVLAIVRSHQLAVVAVLHTHAHIDHLMGTFGVVAATGAAARLHGEDRPLWDQIGWVAARYRIPRPKTPPLGEPLTDGERIQFGSEQVSIVHTPGHTPGSCCFAFTASGSGGSLLLSGDTLFRGMIGKAFPGTNGEVLVSSIRDRLLTLDDNVRVVPGHGPETSIGDERRHNRFLSHS